ncbi:MAG: hypothetical protein AMXMBFR7_51330 [Planctomycetota bacterium]
MLLAAAALSLGPSAAFAATIYVDGKLGADCKGTYSVKQRDASGQDGDAYPCLSKASAAAKAGDTVAIRAGTYQNATGAEINDVLAPKHSGTAERPIVYRAYEKEPVVIGGGGKDYPPEAYSVPRTVLVLLDVEHLVFEDLRFENVVGWVFARRCKHIAFARCVFKDGLNGGKGSVKMIECDRCRWTDCLFRNSGFDSLILEDSNYNLIEHCTFDIAAHCLLAIRSGNFNVIRNCHFTNSYYVGTRAEKLIEVYDIKTDSRSPDHPAFNPVPKYDQTKYNLFERNYFGYTPFRPNKGAQPSSMQYSGQCGIIRRNIFCNPQLDKPNADFPEGVAGGMAMNMRWGGSWEGWQKRKDGTGYWLGEGHEAGFVSHNRIFHNTFHGFDNGCVTVPSDDAMNAFLNPPPMEQKQDSKPFHKKFEFKDNLFKNNLFLPEAYRPHIEWAWKKTLEGHPVAFELRGNLAQVRFEGNNVFTPGKQDALVAYVQEKSNTGPSNLKAVEEKYPGTFAGNTSLDPLLADFQKGDFRLTEKSPLIDKALPLTETAADGTRSKTLAVTDAGWFYDGFGITGEQGDEIQLSDGASARILKIDYAKHVLELDAPLTWKKGQRVFLKYSGQAADVGALEFGQTIPQFGVRTSQ